MAKAKRIAVCPGTFDPMTYGHEDIVLRGLKTFDQVIVAVAEQGYKNALFSIDERVDMIRHVLGRRKNVSVESFRGLVVEYAEKKKAQALIIAGKVEVDAQCATKPGSMCSSNSSIVVKEDPCPYVSRGGLKLEKGLEYFQVDPKGFVCADIGASTGGLKRFSNNPALWTRK